VLFNSLNFVWFLGLVLALLPLGFYKYFNFFILTFAHLISLMGLSASLPTLSIILPVGISFYTFQALGYVIDVYRRKQTPESDPLIFALYMAYFPHLVAGPIQRADHLIPALRSRRTVCRSDIGIGLELMLSAMFEKSPSPTPRFGRSGPKGGSPRDCRTGL